MSRRFATPPGTRFSAADTIRNIISAHVKMLNLALKDDEKEAFERFRAETMGMLICLKNITVSENRFYNINIYDDRVEFGYYDDNHKWNVIK